MRNAWPLDWLLDRLHQWWLLDRLHLWCPFHSVAVTGLPFPCHSNKHTGTLLGQHLFIFCLVMVDKSGHSPWLRHHHNGPV